MAGVLFNVNSGDIALVAATAKTVLQIKAAANQRVLIRHLRFMGKQPAGGTDTPVKIRMTRSTANFGTATGAATVCKNNQSDGETLQTSTGQNFTVEPTTPTDGGIEWLVQPQSGVIEFLPPDRPIVCKGGEAVNFECTSPATPTLNLQVTCEE